MATTYHEEKLREWLQNYKDYSEYRKAVIMAKQAMPYRTVHVLTEQEFDRYKWGVGVAEDRNYDEHQSLSRRIDAIDSRVEGALGNIYGFEGKGGLLEQINANLFEVKTAYQSLDHKFDALIMKQEQDKAHQEAKIVKLDKDVADAWKEIRKRGSGWKKFKDAAVGAAAVGAIGLLIAWLRSFGAQIADVLGSIQHGGGS